MLPDGRRLSSVSAVVRDDAGHACAVLCVNVDRSPFTKVAALLAGFAGPAAERPGVLIENDWIERVNQTVGAFRVRRAIPVVAGALSVSRSTVYSLLAERERKAYSTVDVDDVLCFAGAEEGLAIALRTLLGPGE